MYKFYVIRLVVSSPFVGLLQYLAHSVVAMTHPLCVYSVLVYVYCTCTLYLFTFDEAYIVNNMLHVHTFWVGINDSDYPIFQVMGVLQCH